MAHPIGASQICMALMQPGCIDLYQGIDTRLPALRDRAIFTQNRQAGLKA
jgi:hypothetical protein